ncbi:MAG TPA: GGDEF domain-containing protein, partial [Gammaproteobacteria bacterium]|nr:GGDEF domain-containing protein [Gammaproteobacteria bacterium]
VRSSDMLYRYGGEEFVLLLSNTTPEGALLLAERIRRKIENKRFEYGDTKLSTTVSLGVANLVAQENGEQLLNRADKALYNAKQTGRNKVEKAKAAPK